LRHLRPTQTPIGIFHRYPIQEIKKKVESSTQVDAVLAAASQAQAAFDEAWKQLEALLKKGGPAKTSVKVQVAEFVKQPFIETEAELDDFVKRLRERLAAEIKAGNRIQIR
jgi:endo-alpha-1,4-polygalactosaminidase (GH114 family)